MTTLAERAAEMAAATPDNRAVTRPPINRADSDELPDVNIDDALDPESAKLTAIQVWSRVRRDIRAVGKDELYNAAGTKYNFRGVDTAVNAFSPVTLRHGVNVIPFKKVAVYRETKTSGGKPQCDCTVTVTWRIYGPLGDFFEAESCGQALDTQDKASAKAQSVAFRVLLFEAGMIPTRETDPEYTAHDRGEAQARDPQDYFTEIIRRTTSRDRLAQIRKEIVGLRLAWEPITNEEGEKEGLLEALDRIGKARFVKPQDAAQRPTNSGMAVVERLAQSQGHVGHGDGEFQGDCPACRMESAAMDRAAAAES